MDQNSASSFTDFMLKDRDVNTMHEENGFHCFEDLDLETREEIEFSLYAMLHHGDEYASADVAEQTEDNSPKLDTSNDDGSDLNDHKKRKKTSKTTDQVKPSTSKSSEHSNVSNSGISPRNAHSKTKIQSNSSSISQLLELDLTADSPPKSKLPPKSPKIQLSSKKKSLARNSTSPLKRNPFSEYVIIEKSVPKSSSIKETEVIDLSDDGDSRCALISRSAKKFPLKKKVSVATVSSDSNSSSENEDSDDEESSVVLLDSNPSNPYSSSSSSCDSLSSDDSDLQVLQEPQMKLNISGSYESTVIAKCSSSGHFPTNWKAFSSKRWTPEMIEFYDKDGTGADLDKIVQSMPRNARWYLEDEDRFGTDKRNRYFGKRRMLCLNCKQTDHVARNCQEPKKVLRCVMCGLPGHRSQVCPNRCCLGCGRRSQIFVECCPECRRERSIKCMICRLNHVTNQCPDLWRRYHATVTGQELPNETPPIIKPNHQLFCSNCAVRGHISFDCPKMRWSKYLPVNPAVFSYQEPSEFLNNLTKGGSTSIATSNDGKAFWIVDNPQGRPTVTKVGNRIKFHIPIDNAPTTKSLRIAKSSVLKEIDNVDINWSAQCNRMVVEFTGKGNTEEAKTRFEKCISTTHKSAAFNASSSPKKPATANNNQPQPTQPNQSKGKALQSKNAGPVKVVSIRYTGSDNKMKRSSLEVHLTNKDKKKVGNRLNQFEKNHRVHITSAVSGSKWDMEISGKNGGNSLLAFKNILKLLKSASAKPTGL